MTFRVPYLPDEAIERDAEALLAQYAHATGVEIRAPIPIEDIVEKHLKLRLEFDDLHRRLDVPRSGLKPDIFGAIFLDSGRIVIDEFLDPEARPEMEGWYRYTLAHEGGGHWQLHRPLVRSDHDQEALFAHARKPTVVCRSSQTKDRVERQADIYASYVLMPSRLVHAEWQDRFGRTKPFQSDLRSKLMRNLLFESVAEPIARRFGVSRAAMRIRLEKLGLLPRAEPKQQTIMGIL
jgi:Zn-dependent peptidase ImmA (M78 family)